MEREIKEQIIENLHLDKYEATKNKYDALKYVTDIVLPELEKSVKSYQEELAKETVDGWLKEVKEKFSDINLNKDSEKNSTIDVQLKFADIWFTISYSWYGNNIPRWYFWDNTKDQKGKTSNRGKCIEILKKADINNYKDENGFLYHEIQKGESGFEIFQKVYNAAKELKYID